MDSFYKGDILKMISLIYRKMQIHTNRAGAAYGLSCGMIPFIMLICENREIPQHRFCMLLDISKGTVTKMLAKLEEQGYVRRKESVADGRVMMVYPTEKAMDIYPKLVEAGDAWVHQMTKGMTEAEQVVLAEALRKVSGNISAFF